MTDWFLQDLAPFDDTAIDPETLYFLLSLAVFCHPTVLVEAGTYLGHFSVPASRLLPECAVWTADPHATILGGAPNLHFVALDFEEMLATHVTPGSVDFAFLDSGPPYSERQGFELDMRLRHWERCKPYMKPGGLMLCDDMNGDWHGRDRIAADCSLILPTGRGLGLWQKHQR